MTKTRAAIFQATCVFVITLQIHMAVEFEYPLNWIAGVIGLLFIWALFQYHVWYYSMSGNLHTLTAFIPCAIAVAITRYTDWNLIILSIIGGVIAIALILYEKSTSS